MKFIKLFSLLLCLLITCANAEERKMYYEYMGSGNGEQMPLLMIAGLASDGNSWGGAAVNIARHQKLLIADPIGAGRSVGTSPDSIDDMVDSYIELLDKLNLKKVHVLGHSMGGMIAMRMAATHPERVGKLILAATSANPTKAENKYLEDLIDLREDNVSLSQFYRSLLTKIFYKVEDLTAAVEGSMQYKYQQANKDFNNQVEAITDFSGSSSLKKITAPTLIIHGKDDQIFDYQRSTNELLKINNSEVVILEKCGHALHLDQTKQFSNAIVSFLKK